MGEHLITTGGKTYRIPAGDDDLDAYLEWLVESRGEAVPVVALSRQQVSARIGGPIPAGFPQPDVVIGDTDAAVRGWLDSAVAAWEAAQTPPEAVPGDAADTAEYHDDAASASAPAAADLAQADEGAVGAGWVTGARRWSGVSERADRMVAILTSRGVVAPSGTVLVAATPTGADLARFVWSRWPAKPATAKGATGKGLPPVPQVWITAPALQAVGMAPPTRALTRSEDLSETVAKLFGCQVTGATAGWFTAVFPPLGGESGEGRRVQLVLLPFLWLDPAPARPKDQGMAGTRDAATELPDDEDAAVALLGERIAWLAGLADTAAAHRSDPPLIPAARPASVGAALLDTVRRRGRSAYRLEACPIPDTVYAETPRLDPDLDNWKNMPHDAKGDAVDVEVDQRAAYLASAGQVELGYGGTPIELSKADPAVFADKPPFGMWRVTTPPARRLDGLSRRLPLPHGHMDWEEPATFWATTRAVQHLLAPVSDGGAGLAMTELVFTGAWVWPQHRRMLRTWADLLRDRLVEATAAGRADQVELIKNMYKAFLGRMAGSQHPPGQRHYQQPAWAATVHADTRWRALRYATAIAATHDLYPIAARDIDTFVYRLPSGLDPAVLTEDSDANGKYRVKKIRGGSETET